jgi:hypothetical protein
VMSENKFKNLRAYITEEAKILELKDKDEK